MRSFRQEWPDGYSDVIVDVRLQLIDNSPLSQ